uniref:acetyl-CoA carboxylase carboxyl transferase beta subunit n=1 Tax=Macrolenes porphyrocarpa TaxID=2866911 RepID=UPI0022376817|nr:acetyl-CoA carboxylase carboxyl transferase beta subunit [Macrolenes porphyrocarpa]UTM97566.1 acetyl-CoA carboxylase carboxyl transferase beta subunit [Macrolenes porphyrocarpa]
MEQRRFNSMLSSGKFEYRYGLSQSIDRFGPIEDTRGSEDRGLRDTEIFSSSDSSSYSNAEHLMRIIRIGKLISNDLQDINRSIYSLYLNINNLILKIDNDLSSLFSEPAGSDRSLYNIEYSWTNHINGYIDSYLSSQIGIENSVLSGNDNSSDSYISSYNVSSSNHIGVSISNHIGVEREKSNERGKPNIRTSKNGIDFTISENSTDFDLTQNYRNLWVQCDNCYGLNYKKFLKSKMNICEQCGYHLKMNSSDRIELSIDPGTWNPMDEDMVSLDPIEFHSEEEPYKDRIDSYQRKTGLTEAVQTGTGRLNGISIAIGVMDFQFMGGSMGSVVGEKITRLIEYATKKLLPLILVCASGGARMQEGSLSLMQMAKISAALYDYQSHKKLFYVSILTSPTTGGVTASFGMLGDIIIAEPNAYIAFAGKRVIEQTLNKTVPEDSQVAEYLFHKGLFDSIVPRNPLKGVLSELFGLHSFFAWK